MVRFSMSDLAEDVGNNTGDFLKDMANNVGNVVCGLYKDYAGNFLGDGGSPVGSFVKGTWDSLCAPRPPGLPTPATPPFSGGQCCDVLYRITFRVVYGSVNDVQAINRPGAINGVETTQEGTSTGFDIVATRCSGVVERSRVLSTSEVNGSVTILGVTRVDGLPDSCGDPPSSQPVVPIPPDRLNPSVPYTYNDGTEINIPINISSPQPTGVLNVDVGSINFRFDAGGVEVEIPDEEEPKKEVIWVVVHLTTLPDKVQFGSPNVYFGGWITFQIDDAYTVRESIHYERSVFRYPDRAQSHHVTFTNGADGDVTTYTTQE